jgi:hypothetical protein
MMQLDFGKHGAPHSDSAAIRGFVREISSQFCPFVKPAAAHGVLTFSDYTADELAAISGGDVAAGLFYISVVHTERLRQRRLALWQSGQAASAALICDNLAVVGSEALDWRADKDIVDWPHYLLKSLYSEVGLMFGKFWTSEQGTSLDGRPIPTTPATFLSIRSAIRLRDPALLRKQTDFADLIRHAAEDRQDVLGQRIGIQRKDAAAQLLAKGNYYTLLQEAMKP